MMQPVRGSITAVFGDRPAVLASQVGHQPQHHRGGVSTRFVAGEPRGDAVPHLAEAGPPSVRVYAIRRGHRGVLCIGQASDDRPVAALIRANTPRITNYDCSINTGDRSMTGSTLESQRRPPAATLAGRAIWVAANLALGYYFLFAAVFFSVLAFHPDPNDPYPPDFGSMIAFGATVSAILMSLAVGSMALVNAALRLPNRDMSRRVFWLSSATLYIAGTATCYVRNYLL